LNFVSHSVILGFTAGAAVLIGFKQIPNLLGLKLERTSLFIESLVQIANHLHETHLITLALGLGTVAVIISLRKLRPSWPGKLIALVVIGGVVALFKLDAQGVAVVGAIPRSLPPFHFPNYCQVHCRPDPPAAKREPGVHRSRSVQYSGFIV
jgi:SulP family sulfate permease